MKKRVLFICVHNSARSQMAEAWLNRICGELFEAQSAGLEAGTINPLVVQAMREMNIDLSNKQTQEVFEVWKSGQMFQYVITVCSEAEAKGCPVFAGVTTRLHWPFPDPSQLSGTDDKNSLQFARFETTSAPKSKSGVTMFAHDKSQNSHPDYQFINR